MKKPVASLLAASLCVGTLAGCTNPGPSSSDPGSQSPSASGASYTYNSYSTALGNNWNPHTWEANADNAILSMISSGFVDLSIKDSENGVYQWVYEMATSITDVTAQHQADLTKYKSTLPEGKTAEDVTEGYVFEIALNPDAKWQDGSVINADSYIYSMKQLLNSKMRNYRANLYISGESAVAGGRACYYSGGTAWTDNAPGGTVTNTIASLVKDADGNYTTADGKPVCIALTGELAWLGGNSLEAYVDKYGEQMFDVESFNTLKGKADAEGNVVLNDESLELLVKVITFSSEWNETADDAAAYLVWGESFDEVDYDSTVGMYKVDDYTIRYVTQNYIDINYFFTSCASTWLVHEGLYEAGRDSTGTLESTNYGTSAETSMSYGPYKIESFQPDRQIVFVQNENWYGYEKNDDGSLVSYTNFEVDGEKRQQYQTTRYVIDVMDEAAAKQAFLKGELSSWAPSAEELPTYSTSDQLYQVDETYTMSFFFNTNVDALKEMDRSKGNTNSVVLSNTNFRKAFSLAVDRDEFVTATAGYKPAYALMNSLYFYDVYNDPTSSYRSSDPAMQAICNLYGVEYGDGTPYATLKDAYNSITGYNLTEAKALMATACKELVEAGLYTEGQPINIRIGWAAGALTSADNNQLALMEKFLNAAVEGSGFGAVTLEAVGNIEDRYSAVPSGEYAIGFGAWGGAAFYPFRNLQVYCDSDQYSINEAACWDPATETLTLTVDGEDVTMTWKDWSNALIGNGRFSQASNELKLEITAQLEQHFLEKYYRIPLAGTTACEMLAFKVSYYTEDYNIMYGFGGLRLMKYNYTDAEWAEFVAEQGGTVDYE